MGAVEAFRDVYVENCTTFTLNTQIFKFVSDYSRSEFNFVENKFHDE